LDYEPKNVVKLVKWGDISCEFGEAGKGS